MKLFQARLPRHFVHHFVHHFVEEWTEPDKVVDQSERQSVAWHRLLGFQAQAHVRLHDHGLRLATRIHIEVLLGVKLGDPLGRQQLP